MAYFNPPEKLVSDGFILRHFQRKDAELFVEAIESSYDHLKKYMAWARPTKSLEEAQEYCCRCHANYLLNKDFCLGIFNKEESKILGGTGFHLRSNPVSLGVAEIGIWIRANQAGKGLGTSVLKAMLPWGKGSWGWRRIEWRTVASNEGSIKVARNAGMVENAVFKDSFRLPDNSYEDLLIFSDS